ncbi:MAG: L-arabinose isomerase [Verrucomicrobiota bacterium]
MNKPQSNIWFVTGSQHLYGPKALRQVSANAKIIAEDLDADESIGARVLFQPVVTTPEKIRNLCIEANSDPACSGIITWMHTFSPAKMWIGGLQVLHKPILHLHTQFNRDIPWSEIDMDFMNLTQSAHGGREFGHLLTRLRIDRTVVVGHWEETEVRSRLSEWSSVVVAWQDIRKLKVARFGDNMRQVAVTEGDKVEAERVFGMSVNTHGVGDLVNICREIDTKDVDDLCSEYADAYEIIPELTPGGDRHESLRESARIELGLRTFLESGGFQAFTDTFEDLHGLSQLPGLAVQRLMADGYGFGAEGDWKHAALVRAMKVMSGDPANSRTSFMEDYTYHFHPDGALCLGSHMLEICPSIAAGKPRCEIHPLGIGGKADPVRLVFEGDTGPAVNASLVDLGNRFRLIINEVESVPLPEPVPNLPVASTLWKPKPSLSTAASSWILAGGAHHTGFSLSVKVEQLEMFAAMAGVECVLIDDATEPRTFKKDLQLSEVYYGIRGI